MYPVGIARSPGEPLVCPSPYTLDCGVAAALPSAQASVLRLEGIMVREPLMLHLGCKQHPGLG